jgi:hypothetical protein
VKLWISRRRPLRLLSVSLSRQNFAQPYPPTELPQTYAMSWKYRPLEMIFLKNQDMGKHQYDAPGISKFQKFVLGRQNEFSYWYFCAKRSKHTHPKMLKEML